MASSIMTPDNPVQSKDFAGIDAVIPFQVSPLDIRGRAVQLGPLLDDILHRHDYPEAVSALLAEVIALTVLLGTSLKFDGKFSVQTQTDGPVSLLVVDFKTPQSLRAYARYDEEQLKAAVAAGKSDAVSLMGTGILAMTVDQGAHSNRYQGIVKLENSTLEEVARQYFRQSEQIPTEIRLAVAQTLTRTDEGKAVHGWRAGGVLVQFLPATTERMWQPDLHGGDAPDNHQPYKTPVDDAWQEDNSWQEARALMATIDDLELTDTDVQPERLLYRLFNEHGVRAFSPTHILDDCSCSRKTILSVLNSFSPDEIAESTINGSIEVNCQFCSKNYSFEAKEFPAEA